MTDESRQEGVPEQERELREQDERVRERDAAERRPEERQPPGRESHAAPPGRVEQ